MQDMQNNMQNRQTDQKNRFDLNPFMNAVTKKVLIILGLTLALILPLTQIENQIGSRREYESIAQKEVAKGWGENVTFGAPILFANEETVYPTNSETALIVESQEKKRGVFYVPVYLAKWKTKLSFTRPASQAISQAKKREVDHLTLMVKPTSAIQSIKVKEVGSGKEVKAKVVDGGIRISVEDLSTKDFFAEPLEIEITARGTGPLSYASNSDQEHLKMTGNWTKPMFIDDVLPTESKVTSQGFEASWVLNNIQKWGEAKREVKSIGLNHLWISTDYSMIERAVKYGVLFIALTFLLIFIVEFMSKAKIHPLQYVSIGLSISVFYLLLLAISEVAGFNVAYFSSSLAVTLLIGFYVRGFLNQGKFVKMVLVEQVVLSGFFYVLLSLEERAFLVGSLGLFIALAIFMTITRRFDWYSGSFKPAKQD